MRKLDGGNPEITIERDDGYLDSEDLNGYFAPFTRFHLCERKALKLAKGRVLDIGLGAGRVSLYLRRRGLDVTGMDISDKALEVSARRGVRKTIKMSACDLQLPKGSFDTVILFGNNFGLCGSPAGVTAMLLRLREIVTDEGIILAETIDPLRTNHEPHLRYHRRNIERGRPPGQVKIRLRYEDVVGDWFDLLFATVPEMRAIAERAGWWVEQVFTDRPASPQYVAVLRKS